NVRLKSSMENLAMQGKLQSKEYKELNAQLKANNRTISENGEKLRLLESRQNVRLKSSMENLAMQGKLQSKEYKELNAQLKAN
ncbi:hypothetical protein E7X23_26320, partial [Bacteroides fragilis]